MVSHDQAVSDHVELDELLDHLEALVHQDTVTSPETHITSCWLSEHADALRILAKHGRFRIVSQRGLRYVTGYWPEHDPERERAS